VNIQRPTSNEKKRKAGHAQRRRLRCVRILLSAALFCASVGAAGEDTFDSVTGPCHLQFPRDHGPHPGYRTEWWYYTGNVSSRSGGSFGFQFTIFRSRFTPPGIERSWPKPPSAWRTSQVYVGHAAVSDISGKRHFLGEQIFRDALDMAGARQENGKTLVHLRNWRLQISPDHHHLTASTDDFSYTLDLTPVKPPIPHGVSGYSRKGSTPERASCYYSFTRLETRGTLTVRGRPTTVQGIAWMDHEFSTAPLEPGIVGWDWFSLQLSDQTEIMVYILRNKDGTLNPASSGTYVDENGRSQSLGRHDVTVAVQDTWKSPHTDTMYPAGWRLSIAPLLVDLTMVPRLNDQEMKTSSTTGMIYWEGSVSAKGTKDGQPVAGFGYVELTGYEKPMEAPM